MNRDIRLSVGFWDHWKTIKLKRILGYEGIESLLRLWEFAAQFHTRGILTGMDIDEIEIAAKWNGERGFFVKTLADKKVRFLDISNGIYSLHDWEDHQGFIFYSENRKKQAKKAIAVRYARQRVNTDSNTDSNTECNTPSPFPSPIPKDIKEKEPPLLSPPTQSLSLLPKDYHLPEYQELRNTALEILHDLNKIFGKKYPDFYDGVSVIMDRLSEGRPREDFTRIMSTKLHDPHFKANKNLYRPETLFAADKFETYLYENPEDYDGQRTGNNRGDSLKHLYLQRPEGERARMPGAEDDPEF
jgi:uncharacterized phage protein (TIGR02220 family)